MNILQSHLESFYELKYSGNNPKCDTYIIKRKRIMIGSSDVCDIIIQKKSISAIHAVIEILPDKISIYDMNSSIGTFYNGKKIVFSEIKVGDKISLGKHEFVFKLYSPDDILPPPLDILRDENIKNEPSVLPKAPKNVFEEKSIPGIFIEYPLVKDPKAEFSEYIFEDADSLYPIFDYKIRRNSIEIILLFKNKIFSVDYLGQHEGLYHIVGMKKDEEHIEFPQFGIDERLPFIEVKNQDVFIFPLEGYSVISLKDNREKDKKQSLFNLQYDEIVCFSKGDLNIFIRVTDHPPRVKNAPIWTRDKDFKKISLIVFLFILFLISVISLYQVDESKEKEKTPERLARILYKKEKNIFQKKAEVKVEKKVEKTQEKLAQVKSFEKNKEFLVKKNKENSHKDKLKKDSSVKALPDNGQKNNVKVVQSVKNNNSQSSSNKNHSQSQKNSKTTSKKGPYKKSQGTVDVFKAKNFSSTLNSLLGKGGNNIKVKSLEGANVLNTEQGDIFKGSQSAKLETAKISTKVGRLSGDIQGSLETYQNSSLSGSDKKSIKISGEPFQTIVKGGLNPDEVSRILKSYKPQFTSCYHKELDVSSESFSGNVRFKFDIGASGHVTHSEVKFFDSSIPEEIRICVSNVLRGIPFSAPEGKTIVSVSTNISFFPNVR